jgi:RimJ/RimL family protein N-acetyltransferase
MDGNDARDRELWFELDQDPEVMRYLNDCKPTTRDELDNFIVPRVAAYGDPARGHGLWEIADRETNEHLGWILVRCYRFDHPQREEDNIELGWRLKRAHWNRGITSEAARAIMDVLRDDPSVRVFSALASPENLASIGVMKKLGMRYVDERFHLVPGRPPYASVYYEMPAR